jgi:hypothetical protein
VRDIIFKRWQEILFLRYLKVPRQCPLVLPVKVRLRNNEASGSKKVKFWDVNFVMSREENMSRDCTPYARN